MQKLDKFFLIFGLIILFIGNIFLWIQTKHFGYNLIPHTPEAVACDAIGITILILGISIIYIAIKEVKENESK